VYFALELGRALTLPMNLWASATRAALATEPWSALPLAGPALASAELLERATHRYGKPAFRLSSAVVEGETVPVRESVVLRTPFCDLVRFERGVARPQDPKLLIVAPLSGHHATLVRETVEAMLPEHDVFVTDWVDAKLVPRRAGSFDLHDYIDLVRRLLQTMGGGAHVMAICQPCVPVLAAVAVMAEEGDRAQPASMTLISGPIDARVRPTRVDRFAREHSLAWLEAALVHRVPPHLAGCGRRVYPGALQLQAFVSLDVARHVEAHVEHFWNVARGDQAAAEKHRRFYDEYFAVMDLPAEFYLQTVAEVFQEFSLPRGEMVHRGAVVRPSAIERTALLTIEGESDDITGLGQTEAAHALCSGIPSSRRGHRVQGGVGHYGTFSGRRWREEIAPTVRRFIRASAEVREGSSGELLRRSKIP